MIKRSKRTSQRSAERRDESAVGLGDDVVARLNGRPDELVDTPDPDPDSETAWMADGKCRLHPPATFFPSDGVGVDKARKICRGCPVLSRCLDYALDERIDHGVWGGCSERERRRILKTRRSDELTSVTITH